MEGRKLIELAYDDMVKAIADGRTNDALYWSAYINGCQAQKREDEVEFSKQREEIERNYDKDFRQVSD